MMGKVKIVATADNHLNRFYDRMQPQKLSRRRKYLRDGFKSAVDYAIEWSAHLFLIAGDLFDQPDPRNIDRVFVAECLGRLKAARVKVCAVSGNHDTPRQSTDQGGYTPQEIYHQLDALTFFDSNCEIISEYIEIEGVRVAIGGLSPDPNWPAGSDPLAGLNWTHNGDLGILLLHGQVEGYSLPDTPSPIFTINSLEALNQANLIIVGDIHRPATKRLGKRLLVIPGATERMTFGENPDVPGFVTVELDTIGQITSQRIQLSGQPRAELRIRVADLSQTDSLADLVSRVEAVATPDTMVKLFLEGFITRDQYHGLQLRKVLETVNPKVFHFTLDTSGLMLADERHEIAGRGIRLSQEEELQSIASEFMTEFPDSLEEQNLFNEALKEVLSNY